MPCRVKSAKFGIKFHKFTGIKRKLVSLYDISATVYINQAFAFVKCILAYIGNLAEEINLCKVLTFAESKIGNFSDTV